MKSTHCLFWTFVAFAMMACGQEAAVPDGGTQDVEIEQTPPRIQAQTDHFAPVQAEAQGSLGSFQGIDGKANQVGITEDTFTFYVPHKSGQVMVRVNPPGNFLDHLDENERVFEMRTDTTFSAVGCQSESLVGDWDFDDYAHDGTLVITPVGNGTWILDFDLTWENQEQDDYHLVGYSEVRAL